MIMKRPLHSKHLIWVLTVLTFLLAISSPLVWGADDKEPPKMSSGLTVVENDTKVYKPDPSYLIKPYDPEAQLIIYGGKYKLSPGPIFSTPARPLFEIGRRLYLDGPIKPTAPLFGSKDRGAFWFMAFGDWRIATGYNNLANNGQEFARLAGQINLDFDMRLTGTERLHAKMTPIDKNGNFTRVDYAIPGLPNTSDFVGDPNLDNVFFEGDVGPIVAGISGKDNAIDVPFSVGLVPMFTQNGVWVDDAMSALMLTPLSAKNSRKLDISNYDVTAFAAIDRITTPAFTNAKLGLTSENTTQAYGFFGFADALRGYFEWGYAYVDSDFNGGSYNNFTGAFTRRYHHMLSNSFRFIANVGQKGLLLTPDSDVRTKTANGVLLLIENSWITSRPSTLVPYFNFFAGFGEPQSLARAANAGGVLKNTGLNFEGETMTALPNLNAGANNTYGGAIGLEYLFNLNQQIVVEGAFVIPMRNQEQRVVQDNQYGLDIRWQKPFWHAWIVRADFMKGWLVNSPDLAGVRVELRRKF
jgi:hypothetical protein